MTTESVVVQQLPAEGRQDVGEAVIRDIRAFEALQPAGLIDEVCSDFVARIEFGVAKYGKRLQTFNGRDALVDLLQELLDAAHYSKQELMQKQDPKVQLVYWSTIGLIFDVRQIIDSRKA